VDTVAMIPAAALGQLKMDPSQLVPAAGDGAFLADFPAAAIDALAAVAGPEAGTPPASVEIRHLGGALARPVPGGGAQPSIDASYLLYAAGPVRTPGLAGPVRAHVQAVKDALAPWHASYDYYNFWCGAQRTLVTPWRCISRVNASVNRARRDGAGRKR
jgi:hypothetical protein